MKRKRCPRKLKKFIIKSCGRKQFHLWLNSDRYTFKTEGYFDLQTGKTILTGRWIMYYNIHDGF